MASITFTLKKQPRGPSKVHADVNGMTGETCLTKVQPFLEALGAKDVQVDPKAEMAEATLDTHTGG